MRLALRALGLAAAIVGTAMLGGCVDDPYYDRGYGPRTAYGYHGPGYYQDYYYERERRAREQRQREYRRQQREREYWREQRRREWRERDDDS